MKDPSAARNLDLPANRSGRDLADKSAEIIELIVTWGASARLASAEILEAVSAYRKHVLGVLNFLSLHGREFLPEDLVRDIDRAASDPEASQQEAIHSRALESLRTVLAQRRDSLVSELGPWAILMDLERMSRLRRLVWHTERAADLHDLVASLSSLKGAQALIEEARASVTAEVRGLADRVPAGSVAGELGELVHRSLQSGDPQGLARSRQALLDIESEKDRSTLDGRYRETRSRIAALCVRAVDEARGPDTDALTSKLLVSANEKVGILLEKAGTAPTVRELQTFLPILTAWEETLQGLLSRRSDPTRATSAHLHEIAQSLRSEAVRLTDRLHETGRGAETDSQARLEEAVEELASAADAPEPAFQHAFDRAVTLIREIRHGFDTRAAETALGLRSLAGDLTLFLEEAADHLPTARVVRARLWLEQADGIVAGGDIASTGSLAAVLTEELAELRRLDDLAKRRKRGRVEREREYLQSEIDRYLGVATGRPTNRLKALSDHAARGEAKELSAIGEEVQRLGRSLEQGVRTRACKAQRAAERWLERAGGTPRSGDLESSLQALRAATAKDDLASLRQAGQDVVSSLRSASMVHRPAFRFALGGLGLAGIVAAYLLMTSASDRPRTYQLRLAGPPATPARIELFGDGRLHGPKIYNGDAAVAFDLRPGDYEIFVNERYTGMVIHVPADDSDVEGIPLPEE